MNLIKCKINECNQNSIGRGYCNKHYLRYKKYGNPLFTKHKKICSIGGCCNKHFGNGLCAMHHGRVRRQGNVESKIRVPLFGSAKERFDKSYIINEITECWEWNRSLSAKGYAHMRMNYTNIQGHRLAYELYKGEIPLDMFVCHSCDNRKCVNPQHLWLGTNQDNMNDMVNKKRGRKKQLRICKIDSCDGIYYCRDYCQKHYARWKRNG